MTQQERQERALSEWLRRRDDRSLSEACEAWDPLPCSFAVKTLRSLRSARLELADLIQEARIGLVAGFRKFDPARGSKFSTFASWQIRGAVGHAIRSTHYLIRPPADLLERRTKAMRLHLDTAEEVAKVLGISVEEAREALEVFETAEPLSNTMIDNRGRRVAVDHAVTDPGFSQVEARVTVSATMPLLHHTDRQFFEQRFFAEMPMERMAAAEGVTRMAMYRREDAALRRARKVAGV